MRLSGFILLIILICLFGQKLNNNTIKLPLTFKGGYGNAIGPAPLKPMLADDDTFLDTFPQINTVSLNDRTVKLLSNLGMLWGFLKYYHPLIAKGDYDWDAELLKILPACFAADSDRDFYATVNHLVDTLGTIHILDKHDTIPRNKIKQLPDFGDLFSPDNLPGEIVKKLQMIRDNYVEPPSNHYIGFDQDAENPIFKNDLGNYYDYPDVGVRLVSCSDIGTWSNISFLPGT